MKKSEQSLRNLELAVASLVAAVAVPPLEDRDYGGIVKAFELAYDLTWKTLKLILEENGVAAPFPRIAFEEAYRRNMIEGNEVWKAIMEARNQSVHTYDRSVAVDLCARIQGNYVSVFDQSLNRIRAFV